MSGPLSKYVPTIGLPHPAPNLTAAPGLPGRGSLLSRTTHTHIHTQARARAHAHTHMRTHACTPALSGKGPPCLCRSPKPKAFLLHLPPSTSQGAPTERLEDNPTHCSWPRAPGDVRGSRAGGTGNRKVKTRQTVWAIYSQLVNNQRTLESKWLKPQ